VSIQGMHSLMSQDLKDMNDSIFCLKMFLKKHNSNLYFDKSGLVFDLYNFLFEEGFSDESEIVEENVANMRKQKMKNIALDVYEKFGKFPSSNYWDKIHQGYPCKKSIYNYFRSYTEFKIYCLGDGM